MHNINILITGKNGYLSKKVAMWLQSKNGIRINQISLRDDSWKSSKLDDYDVIIHVAGVTPQNTHNKEMFYQVNYQLTKELAEKAKQEGVRQFIYISTMAVYGLEQQMSVEQGTIKVDTPCLPVTDYGKSKLLAEECLTELEDEEFKVSIIRVPSIYGKGKTEYIDQYKHLSHKFFVIPYGFCRHYKSAIYIDSLCELIFLAIKNKAEGIICPDDGQYSAYDYCKAVAPSRKKSRFLGLVFEMMFQKNDRIRDYYGAICYAEKLTNIFDGKYRVCDLKEAVRLSYEE